MKRLMLASLALSGVLSLNSCDQSDINVKVDFEVSLDSSNTYRAGEPVRFNFDGNVENIVFFSGEDTHMYKYKDRYTLSKEDVKSAQLKLSILSQYGHADSGAALEMYVSNRGVALSGLDYDADTTLISSMLASGMDGWTLLDSFDGGQYNGSIARALWPLRTYDLGTDYIDSFNLAFHFHPNWDTEDASSSWRKFFFLQASVEVEIEGISTPVSLSVGAMNATHIWMTPDINVPDKYATVAWNANTGGPIIDYPSKNQGYFGFVGGRSSGSKKVDVWWITEPFSLNLVDPDQGEVIKGFEDHLDHFEYVFDNPGTYKVSFIGSNASHLGSSSVVREVDVIVVDNI